MASNYANSYLVLISFWMLTIEQLHALYQSADPAQKKAIIQAWLANGPNMQVVMKEEMANQMGTKDETLTGHCAPGQVADLTCMRRQYFGSLQEFQARLGQMLRFCLYAPPKKGGWGRPSGFLIMLSFQIFDVYMKTLS